MALQPAAGARDLNPREVDGNRWLCDQLAATYRLWGYAEVTPPSVERLETLEAGGGIDDRELVRLAADEPLGLRPEMTASIARAACTRMAGRPRPLRLWSSGTVFRSGLSDSGQHRLEERLQSGVELLGEGSDAAEMELMHLLLTAVSSLGLRPSHQPTLLVGHHALLGALLDVVPEPDRVIARERLTAFDALGIDDLPIPDAARGRLRALLQLRGDPRTVLYQLEQWLGQVPLLRRLETLLISVEPLASAGGVRLQLDPTFQPHFDLYDGLVFKLVCQGPEAPVAIASGGRYDRLMARFCDDLTLACGTGFGFSIAALQELLCAEAPTMPRVGSWLVVCADARELPAALERMASLHARGESAELCSQPCRSEAEAQARAVERGCRGVIWMGSNP